MSKKFIAIASAAALALSGLVGVSAYASSQVNGEIFAEQGGTGLSAKSPVVLEVSSHTTLRDDDDQLADITITNTASRAVVQVEASEGVYVMSEADYDAAAAEDFVEISSGSNKLNDRAETNGEYELVAWTTSTAVGTVKVTVGNATITFYLKGQSNGYVYKTNFVKSGAPTPGGEITLTGNFKDMWGNDITDEVYGAVDDESWEEFSFTSLPTNLYNDDAEYDSDAKAWTMTLDMPSEQGSAAWILEVDDAFKATKIAAFGNPVTSQRFSENVQDQSALIATLQAVIAKKVTKKRYNTLARKWNRAFPNNKVWVKP
jgi:hypothetical protein